MTPEELERIRARDNGRVDAYIGHRGDDRHTLLAEVDRLTAENERLKAALIKIRDADYRGNRSPESRMAYDALKGQP